MKILIVSCLFVASSLGAPSNPRVVGGQNAELGDVPYIISLQRTHGGHSCGGSFISNKYILTAAHCVSGFDPSTIEVKYGALKLNHMNTLKVEEVIAHENYVASITINDIALLKLAEPATFGPNVKAAFLPLQDEAAPGGEHALLAGWGNDGAGNTPNDLQKVNLTIVDIEECKKLNEGQGYYNLYDTNLCAGVPEGGKGQCNGDSGGPLTYKGKVVGLVSWSIKPCTVKGHPGVYTRVASYRDWIKEKSGL